MNSLSASPNNPRSSRFDRGIVSSDANVLASVYEGEINLAIWRRTLSSKLKKSVSAVLESEHNLRTSIIVSPINAHQLLSKELASKSQYNALTNDISDLVDMFCCLFDLEAVGLRLASLEQPMCPRFHIDHVPCRLITTYQGDATEWIPDHLVDRSKLGAGNQGLPDQQSGIFQSPAHIQHLMAGDVALLKGESWDGNENGGLVHRSPTLKNKQQRLILTLDFYN